MPRAKFLHTADLHLCRPFGFLPPLLAEERRRDQRKTLTRIVDIAIEREVNIALFSGDMFDSADPDPTDLEAITKEFTRLAESGTKLFVIPGNHDYVSTGSFWHHLNIDGLHNFLDTEWHSVVLSDLNISISGIAFNRTKSERRAFEGLEVPTEMPGIVMVHASYEQFDGQLERYHPFSAGELSTCRASYVALGHYHRYNVFTEAATTACYPGTPEGLGFDAVETEDRQIVIGEIDDNGVVQIEPVKVNRRIMRSAEIDCTSFDSRTSLFDAVRRFCDPNAFLQLKLAGTPNTDTNESLNEIPERFRDSCSYLMVDSSDVLLPTDLEADDRTIRGRFSRHLLDQINDSTDPERRRLLQRALELGIAAFTER